MENYQRTYGGDRDKIESDRNKIVIAPYQLGKNKDKHKKIVIAPYVINKNEENIEN